MEFLIDKTYYLMVMASNNYRNFNKLFHLVHPQRPFRKKIQWLFYLHYIKRKSLRITTQVIEIIRPKLYTQFCDLIACLAFSSIIQGPSQKYDDQFEDYSVKNSVCHLISYRSSSEKNEKSNILKTQWIYFEYISTYYVTQKLLLYVIKLL